MEGLIDWGDDIIAQPLSTIADSIDPGAAGCEVRTDSLRGKHHDQVVGLVFLLDRKIFLGSGQQLGSGAYPFLCGPGIGAVGNEPNAEFAFIIIGGGLDQAAYLLWPTGVSSSEAHVRQGFDAHGSFRRLRSKQSAGREEATKDEANYPSARSHQSIRGRLGRVKRRRNRP